MSLSDCALDLSHLSTPADFLKEAGSPESVEKLEECMAMWCKQIEQVGVSGDEVASNIFVSVFTVLLSASVCLLLC